MPYSKEEMDAMPRVAIGQAELDYHNEVMMKIYGAPAPVAEFVMTYHGTDRKEVRYVEPDPIQ